MEKRTVLALYKGSETPSGIAHHPLHRFLEMPLNHIGLKATYWDIEKGIPDLKRYADLRGIVSWYMSDQMQNPMEYLTWAKNCLDSGLKFLAIGLLGCERNTKKKPTPLFELNTFLKSLGCELQQSWQTIAYDVNFVKRFPFDVEFEQSLTQKFMGLPYFKLFGSATVLLYISSDKDSEPPLPAIFYTPNGGYALESLMISINQDTALARWNTNPFFFLSKVFQTDSLPKPDISTLSGKRIFFSHIDGDGWQSVSFVDEFKHKQIPCAQVIYEKVVKGYPHLPVTIAPIAADLDPQWHGNKKAIEIAKKLFLEPNVEAASHTYSHPLYWAYYDDPNAVEKELKEFGNGKNASFLYQKEDDKKKIGGYAYPRAFLEKPYNLENEIKGSVDYIKSLLPKDKSLRLLQWSGDCEPFEKALQQTKQFNLLNMNGGDSRFDEEYPSYSSVAPVGREIGSQQQIYAVNSNENTYTNNWSERFFGYKYLKTTFQNTEHPIRIKPMNVYYHMYSGENDAALKALLSNLDYVEKQDIIPIEASAYAELAEGFYKTKIVALGDLTWAIQNRGKLQTIRFDHASDLWINFKESKGVIGAKHYQQSLYVALDLKESDVIIACQRGNLYVAPPKSERPYLLSSNWRIWDVSVKDREITFWTNGYGVLFAEWCVPIDGKAKIQVGSSNPREVEITKEGLVLIQDVKSTGQPVQIKMTL